MPIDHVGEIINECYILTLIFVCLENCLIGKYEESYFLLKISHTFIFKISFQQFVFSFVIVSIIIFYLIKEEKRKLPNFWEGVNQCLSKNQQNKGFLY